MLHFKDNDSPYSVVMHSMRQCLYAMLTSWMCLLVQCPQLLEQSKAATALAHCTANFAVRNPIEAVRSKAQQLLQQLLSQLQVSQLLRHQKEGFQACQAGNIWLTQPRAGGFELQG